MAPPDVIDAFRQYVINDIPKRLIDVYTLELVERESIERYFAKEIDDITEDTFGYSKYERAVEVREAVKWRVAYAIFSHRWLAREPTYKEMLEKDPASLRGPAYKNLRAFCEEAKGRGFRFVWSDTCCIDRTSNVELDESIRSMFQWYQNSALCIVHLAQTTSLDDLKDDEWFRRGWTLQELLAPPEIKFFNRDWKPLTDRDNDKQGRHSRLLNAIREATGIPVDVICKFTPTSGFVDEVMAWAARRRTTRAEDIAYSLMGIFDVSMQIAYGEGATRAFRRLIEAIIEKSGSPSVLNFKLTHDNTPALPQSPADYLGHPRLNNLSHRLDMALTTRGLRVPLILLPFDVLKTSDQYHAFTFKFGCTHYRIDDISASIPSHNLRLQHGSTAIHSQIYSAMRVTDIDNLRSQQESHEFALGIFLYIPPEDNANPALAEQSVAYLLGRRRTRTPSQPSGWKRLMTEEFITVLLPGSDSNMHRYIDRSHLKTVYL